LLLFFLSVDAAESSKVELLEKTLLETSEVGEDKLTYSAWCISFCYIHKSATCGIHTNSQPRSQALSPWPPFVVGRKTLAVAGHMTSQNLVGKNICWVGGVVEVECFDGDCNKHFVFQNLKQLLKTMCSIEAQSGILLMKNATLFLLSHKYRACS